VPEDVIVATVGGVVVGYARIGRHMRIPANDHVLHLEALAVSPHARRSGIGSLLIEATIAEARRRGARKLGLRALSTNVHAIRLYENHGFREEARLTEEIRLSDGSFADDVWFALPLA
jgi:ribosomal protein S18 acetylase RimI-like enzyme